MEKGALIENLVNELDILISEKYTHLQIPESCPTEPIEMMIWKANYWSDDERDVWH